MIHVMTLYDEYYELVKNGSKKIEYRLNDEKRKKIKIGDIIIFHPLSNENETTQVRVIDLKVYKNLLAMYTATFDSDFKHRYSSPQEVVDDSTYYSKENRENHEALAIYIQLI